MDAVSLTTDRMVLRPFAPGDEPDVVAACSDPVTARWTTVPSPYTGAHARTWVREVGPAGWADGSTAGFAAVDAATGRLQASVSLMDVADGSAELGYWAAPWARRRGSTAEAVRAVCRWGFDVLGLERVLWQAEVGNWGSRAVAESCGVTVEGTLRAGLPARGGGRADAWAGSLLATDDVRDRRAFGGRWTDLPGEGLLLRRWRHDDVDDLDAVVAGLADPESARWLDVPVPYGPEAARAFLAETPRLWADGVAARLAVEVDGRAAGLVVLLPSSHDPACAEVGWWTVPSARGRGVATRAVRTLLPWAARLGHVRLTAGVAPGNATSLRVAERAGFAPEGVARLGRRGLRCGARADLQVMARVAAVR